MIISKEKIIEYFQKGIKEKKNFKIGIEHEKFLFSNKDNKLSLKHTYFVFSNFSKIFFITKT